MPETTEKSPKDIALRARRAAQRWLGIASDSFLKLCDSVPQGQYREILSILKMQIIKIFQSQ